MLKIAPVFMMVFGYWIFGNRQIFYNLVSGREYRTDPVITSHNGRQIGID